MASGDIVFIDGDNRARFPDSHCLFVDDELPAVIDPATKRDELEGLHREKGIGIVVNSHYHIDHTRYDSLFNGAELLASAVDAPAIEDLDELARATGVDDAPWFDIWKSTVRERWNWTERHVALRVEDRDELCLGMNTLRFIHAPGHTAGHMCVHFVEKGAVFLADIELGSFGPWYANRGSDVDAFLDSIEKLKALEADTWYTSHGKGVLQGDIRDRLDAFAGVIYERDERLLEFLSRPRTREEIVSEALIYRRRWEPPQLFELFEWNMASKHLARLERLGLAARDGDRWLRT